VAYILNASDQRPIHQHNMVFETSLCQTCSPSLYHRNCNIFLITLSIIT